VQRCDGLVAVQKYPDRVAIEPQATTTPDRALMFGLRAIANSVSRTRSPTLNRSHLALSRGLIDPTAGLATEAGNSIAVLDAFVAWTPRRGMPIQLRNPR
jgi:hypothetical protein